MRMDGSNGTRWKASSEKVGRSLNGSHHRQMVDLVEWATCEAIHCLVALATGRRWIRSVEWLACGSHHRQMVDCVEWATCEAHHRLAALATGRRGIRLVRVFLSDAFSPQVDPLPWGGSATA
jgi:hypothetical protein